jgi:hypothetical protein
LVEKCLNLNTLHTAIGSERNNFLARNERIWKSVQSAGDNSPLLTNMQSGTFGFNYNFLPMFYPSGIDSDSVSHNTIPGGHRYVLQNPLMKEWQSQD